MRLTVPADQRHQIQENVDVGQFVVPLANNLEPSQDKVFEQNVDLLAPTAAITETEPDPPVITPSTPVAETPLDESIPWHTFPVAEVEGQTEVNPQAIAQDVKQQLLTCQSPHHFHQLIAQFGQAVIDWVMETLIPASQRPSLTQ